ncbi:MAG: putative secreted protein, partial [Herbinix sp.]|nr:putative secreted protein [Herbinix sp.]
MKKYAIYVLLFITVIVLIGCKKKSGEGDTDNLDTLPTAAPTKAVEITPTPVVENHDGEMKSYLSGQWVTKEIGTKRPWAIQFNNFKAVSNQSGISQADILYECIVEGGITRLLGIGENYTGDRFGSVRSSRHYFVSIADEYDAIYVHYGKTKYATSKMNELGIDHMDGTTMGATVFYRDDSIKAPNNAFTSVEGIQAGIKKMGFETE